MEEKQAKEELEEIERRIEILRWDKEHNNVYAKDHIYDGLCKRQEELKAQLAEE